MMNQQPESDAPIRNRLRVRLDAGIDEQALPKLADLAFQDACHRENPKSCTRDDLLALYRASL